MTSEIERARRAISGEPVVDGLQERWCFLCSSPILQNGDDDDKGCAADIGDKFVAGLWRRAHIDPEKTYNVVNLYHYRHYEKGRLHIDAEQEYHQLVVSATAGIGTVDEDKYSTAMLTEIPGPGNKYAVFEDINGIMYSGPDHGRPIE